VYRRSGTSTAQRVLLAELEVFLLFPQRLEVDAQLIQLADLFLHNHHSRIFFVFFGSDIAVEQLPPAKRYQASSVAPGRRRTAMAPAAMTA
jgi:hypothetical protein